MKSTILTPNKEVAFHEMDYLDPQLRGFERSENFDIFYEFDSLDP